MLTWAPGTRRVGAGRRLGEASGTERDAGFSLGRGCGGEETGKSLVTWKP